MRKAFINKGFFSGVFLHSLLRRSFNSFSDASPTLDRRHARHSRAWLTSLSLAGRFVFNSLASGWCHRKPNSEVKSEKRHNLPLSRPRSSANFFPSRGSSGLVAKKHECAVNSDKPNRIPRGNNGQVNWFECPPVDDASVSFRHPLAVDYNVQFPHNIVY